MFGIQLKTVTAHPSQFDSFCAAHLREIRLPQTEQVHAMATSTAVSMAKMDAMLHTAPGTCMSGEELYTET
jgi:hypothetical protein